MKSNVLVKLSARNSRIPIDLFRSIEYSLRLQHKQQKQQLSNSHSNNTRNHHYQATSSASTVMTSTTTTTGSNTNSGSAGSSLLASPRVQPQQQQHHQQSVLMGLPQRGAFVQMPQHTHMRPRSKLLNRARQQSQLERESQLKAAASMMMAAAQNNNKSQQLQFEEINELGKEDGLHPVVLGQANQNNNVVIMNAIDLKSLEMLEDKVIQNEMLNFLFFKLKIIIIFI